MNRPLWSALPLCLLLAGPAFAQQEFPSVDALVAAHSSGQVAEGDLVKVTRVRVDSEIVGDGNGGDFHDVDEYHLRVTDDGGTNKVTLALSGYFDSSYDPTGSVDMAAEGIDSVMIGLDDPPTIKRGYEIEILGFVDDRGAQGLFLTQPIGNGFTRQYDDLFYEFQIDLFSTGYAWYGDHKVTIHSTVHDPLPGPTNLVVRPSGAVKPGTLIVIGADGIDTNHTEGRLILASGATRRLHPILRTEKEIVVLITGRTPPGTHAIRLENPNDAFSAEVSIEVEAVQPVVTSAVKVGRKVIATLSNPLDVATFPLEMRVWRYDLENVRGENSTAGRRIILTGDLPANPLADRGRSVRVRLGGGEWSRWKRMMVLPAGAGGSASGSASGAAGALTTSTSTP